MARQYHRLTPQKVLALQKPGLHADGLGLYLQVSREGTKSWIYRYLSNGKDRWKGLGPFHTVSLADARQVAKEMRALRLTGIDPLEEKDRQRQAAADLTKPSFRDAAASYIEANRSEWKSDKHAAQWSSTLEKYAYPVIGDLQVDNVTTDHLIRILQPIWRTKFDTASRLRGRVEHILDREKSLEHRTGDNPARLRGHLDHILGRHSKQRKKRHFPALPYVQIGAFMERLREQEGMAARALEVLILTGVRTGEIIGARWCEIDLATSVWIIPADRMKAGKEHRVPLSQPAKALLQKLFDDRLEQDKGFVFPGGKVGRPLSNMAMLELLGRMKRGDITVHGFRSTFRDWASEQTNFSRDVCEAALAHTIPDAVERAYRRGDLFQKRSQLMEAWSSYCEVSQAGALRAAE